MITIILIALLFILLAFAPVHIFLNIADDFNICTRAFLIQALIIKIHTPEVRIIPSCFIKEKNAPYEFHDTDSMK